MVLKNMVFVLCLMVLLVSILGVLVSPGFSGWERKDVSWYYLEGAQKSTGSTNLVSAIVWDFRGFDTLGEETVLFTAAVGVFTVIIFGLKIKREMG